MTSPLIIPETPWPVIGSRLQERWIARDAPHHSIIAQTRSGKSYLVRHGILPVCKWDRVLILDGKGGTDATLQGLGQPVNRFPTRALRSARQLMQDRAPCENWFQLIASGNRDRDIKVFGNALERVKDEGDWIVVVDELRWLIDTREPGLGLKGLWEAIIFRGGGHGIGMVSLTQEPSWVPSSFYTQSSFYWFGRVEDQRALDRIAEIGTSRELRNHLIGVKRRKFIYMDNLDDDRFWAMTSVTGPR